MGKLLEFAPLPARPAASSSALSRSRHRDTPFSPQEFIRTAVELIPTDFGRLALLGSLQDKETGTYRSAFAALSFDDDAIDEALLQLHEKAFAGWLTRDLPSQIEDAVAYCRAGGQSAREVVANWIARLDHSGILVPSRLPQGDRRLFCRQLATVLATAYGRLP